MKLMGVDIDLPGYLSDFCLTHQSRIVEVTSRAEHFGNFVVRFSFGDNDLRFVRDRGQVFVEAKSKSNSRWQEAGRYLADSKSGFSNDSQWLESLKLVLPSANNVEARKKL